MIQVLPYVFKEIKKGYDENNADDYIWKNISRSNKIKNIEKWSKSNNK